MLTTLKLWWHVRRLEDSTNPARAAAAEALGRLADPRAAGPLTHALHDTAKTIRRAAAEALGRIGAKAASGVLLRYLGDEDAEVRKATAVALATLGEPKWQEWVQGEREDFRRLGNSCDAGAVTPLVHALSSWYSFKAAAEALCLLGNPQAVDPLIHMLGRIDKDCRRIAADALGKLRDARSVAPLLRALTDQEDGVREAAAEALGRLRDSRAVEPLIRALGDDKDAVRSAAIASLVAFGDARAVASLVERLQDKSAANRGAAAEALARFGDPNSVAPLVALLGDRDPDVRKTVAGVLAQMGRPKWAEWVKGDEKDIKRLGASGDPEAVAPLVGALGNPHWSNRKRAATALAALAARCPTAFGRQWQTIRERVMEAHSDRDTPSCSFSNHGDEGIGMTFPRPPAGTEF